MPDSIEEAASGRVVVGVDGSVESKDALRWAAHYAELTHAKLEVVMAWHVPTFAYGAPLPVADYDFSDGAKQTLESAIAEVLGDHPAVRLTTLIEQGQPALKLLEAATGAQLLVVGSRGHGAFTGMLLGSVSEHCASHATCPVVVVRHSAEPAGSTQA